MKKIIKYLFYSVIMAYLPLLFLVPVLAESDGFITVPYLFVLVILAFYSFPLATLSLEGGLVVGLFQAQLTKKEKIFVAIRIALMLVTLIVYFFSVGVSCVASAVLLILHLFEAFACKRNTVPEILKKRSFWLVVIVLVLCVSIAVLAIRIYNASRRMPDPLTQTNIPNEFEALVVEMNKSSMVVAPIGENGETRSAYLFSLPNYFPPEADVSVGDVIFVSHSGLITETYPAGLAEVYSVRFEDENGKGYAVNID